MGTTFGWLLLIWSHFYSGKTAFDPWSTTPCIQITLKCNETNSPFLDVMLIKTGNLIETDIFYKNTDACQYLDFRSYYPRHLKRNLRCCPAKRNCTMLDDDHKNKMRLGELATKQTKEHYTKQITCVTENDQRPVEKLRKSSPKQGTRYHLISFVTTHNQKYRYI